GVPSVPPPPPPRRGGEKHRPRRAAGTTAAITPIERIRTGHRRHVDAQVDTQRPLPRVTACAAGLALVPRLGGLQPQLEREAEKEIALLQLARMPGVLGERDLTGALPRPERADFLEVAVVQPLAQRRWRVVGGEAERGGGG